MNVAPVNARAAPKRMGRPPIGTTPKTHEDHKERMRDYAQQQRDDSMRYRYLMQNLPKPMTVDEILVQLIRMNINAPSNGLPSV